MTIDKGLKINQPLRESYCNCNSFCYFMSQTKNICNFLNFCLIFMIFIPKCRALYVVSETGHGAGKKGMALEKKGMAAGAGHAKTG